MSGRELTELVVGIKELEGRRSERYKEEREQRYKELVLYLNYRIKETVRRMMGGLPEIEKETVVENCCSIGVMKAVREFNGEYEFLTFFYKVIKTIISNHMKCLGYVRNGGRAFTVRFSELEQEVEDINRLDKGTAFIVDEITNDNDITVRTIRYRHVCNGIMDTLKDPETKEVFLWLSKGYKWEEISRNSRSSWVTYKALLKLRKNPYAKRLLKDYGGGTRFTMQEKKG